MQIEENGNKKIVFNVCLLIEIQCELTQVKSNQMYEMRKKQSTRSQLYLIAGVDVTDCPPEASASQRRPSTVPSRALLQPTTSSWKVECHKVWTRGVQEVATEKNTLTDVSSRSLVLWPELFCELAFVLALNLCSTPLWSSHRCGRFGGKKHPTPLMD